MEGSANGRVDTSRTAALPATGRPDDRGNAVTAEDGFKGRRRALTVDSRCAVVLLRRCALSSSVHWPSKRATAFLVDARRGNKSLQVVNVHR